MSDLKLKNGIWSLEDLPDVDSMGWITVDIGDGSWTQLDPTGFIVNAASTVNDITKVTYNAVTGGNNVYDPTVNNDYEGPRWYANLETTDGTRINSDDNFIINFEIVNQASTTQQRTNLLIGIGEDPTSTDIGTINFTGGIFEFTTNTAHPGLGVYTARASPVFSQNTNNKIGFSTFACITNRIGNISAFNLAADGSYIVERSTTSARSFSSGTNLFLMIQAGLVGSNTITACDIQAKLRYRIIKFSDFPT